MVDNPFLDFQLTFGDWVALGDWFEDVDEVRSMLRPGAKGQDRIGELYYALFARIRPKSEAEMKAAQKLGGKEDGLWTEADAKAVDARYQRLKTRNIKHFSNPLVGDLELSLADKVKRTRDGKPLGGIAQYHHDHLKAIKMAIAAAHVPDERRLGDALATDAFACHFLTDAFSGSHARTPRSSIEAYWDKKVPGFDKLLVNWLADEATFVVVTQPTTSVRKRGLPKGIEELGAGILPGKARAAIRELIRPEVPELSFGDIVGLRRARLGGRARAGQARSARRRRRPAVPARGRRRPAPRGRADGGREHHEGPDRGAQGPQARRRGPDVRGIGARRAGERGRRRARVRARQARTRAPRGSSRS